MISSPIRRTAATLIVLGLAAFPAAAQIQDLPQASPRAEAQQRIGITDVKVTYHRPAVQEREIWGALVPWDQVWRAGANENTVLELSTDVTVEGQPLAAGSYGVHMIPGADEWTAVFSSNHTSWGSFSYDEGEDALRVKVKPESADHQEWLRYAFEDLAVDGATLALHWEKVRVPIRIETDTHELALAHIRRELRGLQGFTATGLLSAAVYTWRNQVAQEEGIGWADRSLAAQESFNAYAVKSGLLAQLGRADEAAEAANKAAAMGNEAQVAFLANLFQQNGLVAQAVDLYEQNAERHPESANALTNLAGAYKAHGNTSAATASLKKALAMVEDADQKAAIQAQLDELAGE